MNARSVRRLTALAAVMLAAAPITPASAADDDAPAPPRLQDNIVAVSNRTDDTTAFRAVVSFRYALGDTLDSRNIAQADASCSRCGAGAVAFQLVLAPAGATTIAPVNAAAAVNAECDACLSWAAAKQIVLVTDEPARLTARGFARLAGVQVQLLRLRTALADRDLTTFDTGVQQAFAELRSIAGSEIVPIHIPHDAAAEAAAQRLKARVAAIRSMFLTGPQ